jgi:hypothetical protein
LPLGEAVSKVLVVPSVRLLAHDNDMSMEAERFATQFNPWATNYIRPKSFTLILGFES